MATILHIESATLTCSVAVAKDGKLIALRESHDRSYAHSEKLVIYIDEALTEASLKATELDAVCVASGPGSYTGLRIGVSAAKGLCYAVKIPLISASSLESMAAWAKEKYADEIADSSILCPMIDARRMEVYLQQFSVDLNPVSEISAEIIDSSSFESQLALGQMVFLGDGAAKCKGVIDHSNALFLDDFNPSARGMFQIAEAKYYAEDFEDVAYFEPYYLKDFVAGKPKRIF